MRGITKRFPGVLANDRVEFEAAAGEVHALLGENGAGKSTLSNILTGLYRPDDGEIFLSGRHVHFHAPRDALDAGICMVHQHFRLVEPFTVAENVVLGDHRGEGRTFRLRHRAIEGRVAELSKRYGLAVDPRARIWQLSLGEQQRVEILKALYREARILILDEPTAVLTPQEANELFDILRTLTREGMSVVFISHKLTEVLRIADRITVLRRGKKIETLPREGATPETLARLMVGREVLLRVEKKPAEPGEPVLRVEGLSVRDERGLEAVRDVSFEVRTGEIVGLAGVDGNGQTELIDALTGLRKPAGGRIRVGDTDIAGASARNALDAGEGHIPQDRQLRGLVLEFSLAENLALHDYRREPDSRFGWLFPRRLVARARSLLREFDVRGGQPQTPASALSGGNQQKLVVAREVSRDPRVLVAAQPTRGLDVGAIEFVHQRLVEERDEGRAVLLVSLELDEVLSLSDRILVIYEGRIVGEYGPDVSDEELGIAMTGGAREDAA